MTNKRISRGAEIRERQRVLERCDFSRLLLRPVTSETCDRYGILISDARTIHLPVGHLPNTCEQVGIKSCVSPEDSSRALAVLRTAELPGAADS